MTPSFLWNMYYGQFYYANIKLFPEALLMCVYMEKKWETQQEEQLSTWEIRKFLFVQALFLRVGKPAVGEWNLNYTVN